jgi:hypothetical protein
MPWTQVEDVDRKGAEFRKRLRDSLQTLFDQGKLIIFGRLVLPQGNRFAERTVLAVPQANVAPFVGRTVDDLLAQHIINPSQILYDRRYTDLAVNLDATVTDTVQAPGISDPNQICIFDYVDASHVVPGASPRSLGVLLSALAVIGGAAAWRRRRRAIPARA